MPGIQAPVTISAGITTIQDFTDLSGMISRAKSCYDRMSRRNDGPRGRRADQNLPRLPGKMLPSPFSLDPPPSGDTLRRPTRTSFFTWWNRITKVWNSKTGQHNPYRASRG